MTRTLSPDDFGEPSLSVPGSWKSILRAGNSPDSAAWAPLAASEPVDHLPAAVVGIADQALANGIDHEI